MVEYQVQLTQEDTAVPILDLIMMLPVCLRRQILEALLSSAVITTGVRVVLLQLRDEAQCDYERLSIMRQVRR